MKRKGILLVAVIMMIVPELVLAADEALDKKLGVTIDATYVSRYIWRGFDVYKNNHSAFQPSVDLDLYGTGLGVNVWMSQANRSGFERDEQINYTLYYRNSAFEGPAAMNYKVGWTYYSYTEVPTKGSYFGNGDAQEIFGGFAWPNLLPGGLVPSYTAVCYWPSEHNALSHDNGGWAHVFGLGYDLPVPGLAGNPNQALHFSADAVYNGGVGPRPPGAKVDHDWSHAVFGVSTGFALAQNLTFKPGFYYQSSWDDSVNTSDEYWTSLSLSYKF
jgi:hypothetical protein